LRAPVFVKLDRANTFVQYGLLERFAQIFPTHANSRMKDD